MTGPRFVHTSGDPNPLNLDQQDRRFTVVDPAADRKQAVQDQFGGRARVVAPYKPNRKQQRAQNAAERAHSKEKK